MRKILLFVLSVLLMTSLSAQTKFLELAFTKALERAKGENKMVFVDCYTSWCGPCKMMLPIVEEISEEFAGKITVAKVDVDGSPSTAAKFGIRNIPTILFFKDGKVADKQVGAVPKTTLVSKINALL